METKDQLLEEVNGFKFISEETKAMFRKVINTVEADLTPDQWRDYELALEQYQQTVVEYRTAREEGRGEAFVEAAKAMKAEGIDPAVISKCTGLGIDEIRKL